MAERKTQLVSGEIYHIVMRAVDGINLFHDRKDYLRMMHDLFVFNDSNYVSSAFRVDSHRNKDNVTRKGGVTFSNEKRKRELLVEILVFCLIPNHIHLLVRQLQDQGISKFMQKFGGYTHYFNGKYERMGHLFQGKFKEVHIENDDQLRTVFVYIHTNPAALIFPGWKEKGITSVNKAAKFIENYRWSSYQDYLGKKNFPSVTSREFLQDIMGSPKECRDYVNDWLRFKRELADLDLVGIE